MYVLENPVLQRELLVNLRMSRGFVLMLVYQTSAGSHRVLRLASRRATRLVRALGRCPQAGRHVLPRPVHTGLLDGTQFCRRSDHRREGTEDVRDAAGQPAATRGDRAGQGHCLAGLLGSADLLLPAHHHAVPAAGRRVTVRGVCCLFGVARVGDHVRRDWNRLQQLLPADGRFADGFLPGDSAAGHGRHSVLVPHAELGRIPPRADRDAVARHCRDHLHRLVCQHQRSPVTPAGCRQ